MGIQCKSVIADLLHRFLTAGVCLEYNITTQVIRKANDGTWSVASVATNGQEKNAMRKNGKIQIAYPDLLAGVLAIYALSAICMVVKRIKKSLN